MTWIDMGVVAYTGFHHSSTIIYRCENHFEAPVSPYCARPFSLTLPGRSSEIRARPGCQELQVVVSINRCPLARQCGALGPIKLWNQGEFNLKSSQTLRSADCLATATNLLRPDPRPCCKLRSKNSKACCHRCPSSQASRASVSMQKQESTQQSFDSPNCQVFFLMTAVSILPPHPASMVYQLSILHVGHLNKAANQPFGTISYIMNHICVFIWCILQNLVESSPVHRCNHCGNSVSSVLFIFVP